MGFCARMRSGGDSMVLRVDAVSKTYLPPSRLLRPLVRTAARSRTDALRGVSLEVGAGEVVGLVGPNGAGKTTLIRIIATLLHQTHGQVVVDGFDTIAAPLEVRRRLGLVLEGDRGLYDRLSGLDNLGFFGVMAGLRPAEARRRAMSLIELVGLAPDDKLVFGYSSGMRSRLSLARALISDPPLLVLDEPTRSLDPVASSQALDEITALGRRGKAVLLSSHRLDEVVSRCSRVIVLIRGRVRPDAPTGGIAGRASASALAAFLAQEAGPR